MYKRKTKDVYIICWKGENVDQVETKQEALYLKKEYQQAFKSLVSIKKKRIKL